MSVIIKGVDENSIAKRLGIEAGDLLLSMNGNSVTDVLDYRFYETEPILSLEIKDIRGGVKRLKVKKPRYGSLGLVFDSYLMDKERSCKNKCIFCFIDQLPKGMRQSLYFKDDDNRLSFLFGNYITLTNIDQTEIERIIKLRISPINVSVHTMDPQLRCTMMNNRFAGESLKFLYMLAKAGIRLNCQLVLCPGINDGQALEYSLNKLMELGEGLESVACVPVGLTRYRQGLYPLRPYTREEAAEVIDLIHSFGDKAIKIRGSRCFYPSDEFFLIAGRELPEYDYYEDFPQIENGVGMFRNLEEELRYALEEAPDRVEANSVSLVTGVAAAALMEGLLDEIRKKWDNIHITLFPVENRFFGGSVDVTGLLTGRDIELALKDKKLKGELLIPDVALKADEDVFLDGMSLKELSDTLGLTVNKVGPRGEELLWAVLGGNNAHHVKEKDEVPWQNLL